MHVARLTPTDALRYRDLMLHAYAAVPDAFTSTPEERAAEPESWWVKRIADPSGQSIAFGAFEGGRLCGTVTIEFASKPKTRHKAHLIGMFVDEACRGTGAGAALVEAALAAARDREGVLVVTLTVTHGNDVAQRLYERCGFRVFGVEPMAIATPQGFRAKVHMVHALSTIEVRSATEADCEDIARLHVASWQHAYADLLPQAYLDGLSVEQRAAMWRKVLAEGRSELLVAHDRGVPLGLVSFGASRDGDAPEARGEVWAIYVAPAAWSRGAGRALWHACCTRLAAQGFTSVSLWVIEGNARAQRFYTSVGCIAEPGAPKVFEIAGTPLREIRMIAPLVQA